MHSGSIPGARDEMLSNGRELKKGDGTLLLISWNGKTKDIASEEVNRTSLLR